ncbi:hypothetical protein D2V17_13920 [Aurantiacibacter xanthus]|uniref:Uncharacterized protein n=1 Tax=Aurantiacibacter xanthus TaxID=1784712 RepID=A0A3A1P6A3_9SPHN|nr:hypothetical protein [Aurantiacibacter xanthus]RIV83278.1 hypothetical protein D2V17_13920 [Aurantiacibacter xanthus]
MNRIVLIAAPMLALAACSGSDDSAPEADATPGTTVAPPTSASPAAETTAQPSVLTLEGLGDLKIGAAVPQGSSWKALDVQVGDGCTMYSSPDYPDTWAMVTGGLVRRISAGRDSDVKLIEGIGAGATEAQVRSYFGGFRETPHKYEEAPAKDLTAPNADSGDPALRFEIGADGKVSQMHVGTMPELGFVEGCA